MTTDAGGRAQDEADSKTQRTLRGWKGLRETVESLLQRLSLHHGRSHSTASGRQIFLAVAHENPLIDSRSGHPYLSNSIRSSRYTIFDFVPKQLLFQVTRVSNFYLICIGIPQAMPGLSPTGSFTTILPLLVFLVLTMAKEGWDDYRRHRLDKIENNRSAKVLKFVKPRSRGPSNWRGCMRHLLKLYSKQQPIGLEEHQNEKKGRDEQKTESHAQWTSVKWHGIKVGDVIRLERNEAVPADIVLLSTSGEYGTAYVETMALDGETDLKRKQSPAALKSCATVEDIASCNAKFVLEDPNSDLYRFEGKVTVDEMTVPLTLNEIVLRGSVLRNTQSVIGLVVNTGEETKIRMNANLHPDAKKPQLEKFSNQVVILLVIYVILLTIGCSVGYWFLSRTIEQHSFYLSNASVSYKKIIIGFAIIFNNIIPLSLYVSLEIVKIGQALMLNGDIEMYDAATDTRMGCNTNTILENLGQINFVLSDKTGTLTDNIMKFQKLSLAGVSFTTGSKAGETVPQSKSNTEITMKETPNEEVDSQEPVIVETFLDSNTELPNFSVEDLLRYVDAKPESSVSHKAQQFLTAMAICNTCMPDCTVGELNYQASSPDELALAQAARDFGYVLAQRNSQSATLLIKNPSGDESNHIFEILDILEFSSKRKRMSIIVRAQDELIWLLCKGADDVIIPRLKESENGADAAIKLSSSVEINGSVSGEYHENDQSGHLEGEANEDAFSRIDKAWIEDKSSAFARCLRHIHEYATDGLRTLVFAHKFIDPGDYSHWKQKYQEAATSLENRQANIEAAAELIEHSLDLLGASAIEDRLQKGVPETIQRLSRANIRVWMLTGDKRETAITIAHSARLCYPQSRIFVLNSANGTLASQIDAVRESLLMTGIHSVVELDGSTMDAIEGEGGLKSAFYSLAPSIDSLILYRASPAQKAAVVSAIKSEIPGMLALAIGDGANDIAMIQSSHVGVGVSGKEGLQAARVADYSIAQFRFLSRLLLVHGHWSYIRTANFILQNFWKEMFFYTMQALYQRYNGYTGTSLYESWSLTALNTLFTSLCVIVPGLFEQDLRSETLLAVPELYRIGQENRNLNLKRFFLWVAGAIAEGTVVWFITMAGYGTASGTLDQGVFALGDLAFSSAIIWTNCRLLLFETHYKSRVVLISFAITVAGWWAWNAFLAGAYNPNATPYAVKHGFFLSFGRDPVWWFTLLIQLMLLIIVQILFGCCKQWFVTAVASRFWFRDSKHGSHNMMSSLAYWQEMEQRPGIRYKLKMLSLHGM